MTHFSYMLAPIEDMTSNAFRSICHKYGADLTFTELTRVEALARKNKSTWSRLEFHDQTPTQIQLLGAKELYFERFLNMFEPQKGFEGFNLNLGCPSPKIVQLGQGCAMVRRISKTSRIIKIFRDHSYNISIKMRLGINKMDKEHKVYIHLLNSIDADFFVVHARYGAQTYDEPADFSVYEECVKTGRRIIANGDIKTKEQVDFVKSVGVTGVMIGREAILDPLIFNKLKGIQSPPKEDAIREYLELSSKFSEHQRYRRNIFKHMGMQVHKWADF